MACHFADFEMSDAQREHAFSVERLVPSFTDLRISLRPHLGDNRFWMIYFILLLPRLNEEDFELLSTPKARTSIHMLSRLFFSKFYLHVKPRSSHCGATHVCMTIRHFSSPFSKIWISFINETTRSRSCEIPPGITIWKNHNVSKYKPKNNFVWCIESWWSTYPYVYYNIFFL